MSKGWPFSLLNDEQMSNWLGVERKQATLSFLVKILEMHIPRGWTGLGAICGPPTTPVAFLSLPVANEKRHCATWKIILCTKYAWNLLSKVLSVI